jgi:hypothetical protein
MEEDCTGKQDRQRTVALEKKNYSNWNFKHNSG